MSLAQWVSKRSWVSILLQALGVLRVQILASLFQVWMLWSKNLRQIVHPSATQALYMGVWRRFREDSGATAQRHGFHQASGQEPCAGSATLSRRGLQSWKNGILINIPDVVICLTVALQNSLLWRVCIPYSSDAAIARNVFGISFTIVFNAWYSSFFFWKESFPLYLAASENTDNPLT